MLTFLLSDTLSTASDVGVGSRPPRQRQQQYDILFAWKASLEPKLILILILFYELDIFIVKFRFLCYIVPLLNLAFNFSRRICNRRLVVTDLDYPVSDQ